MLHLITSNVTCLHALEYFKTMRGGVGSQENVALFESIQDLNLDIKYVGIKYKLIFLFVKNPSDQVTDPLWFEKTYYYYLVRFRQITTFARYNDISEGPCACDP